MYDNIVKNKSIILLCHTALGDPTDPHGRYFEVGKEYSADIETVNIGFDTKFSPCVLLWINFNSGYGSIILQNTLYVQFQGIVII